MKLDRLIRILQELQAKGFGRHNIVCDKGSLFDGNGSWVMCNIQSAKADVINMADDDGFLAVNKNGTEKMSKVIILSGER